MVSIDHAAAWPSSTLMMRNPLRAHVRGDMITICVIHAM